MRTKNNAIEPQKKESRGNVQETDKTRCIERKSDKYGKLNHIPHRTKYKNKKITVDGITFDSKKEAQRYSELKILERGGKISQLVLQPRFELQESFKKNGKTYRKIEYVADFMYRDNEKNVTIVEDVKGVKTDVYKLKRKMFEKVYKTLSITEI